MPELIKKLNITYIYTIGHYNPSVRIIDLVSHTTYVVCVNFIHELRDLQFKIDSEEQISEKLFIAILFYLRIFVKNLSQQIAAAQKYFFILCIVGYV